MLYRMRFLLFLFLVLALGATPLAGAVPRDTLRIPNSFPAQEDSIRLAMKAYYALPIDSLQDKVIAFQPFYRGRLALVRVPIDTMLTGFQIKNVVKEQYAVGSYLGNLGLSAYSPLFHLREQPGDFMFTDHVAMYMHTHQEMIHYQARTPYTLINYTSAGEKRKDEMTLHLIHTQNVTKDLNLGVLFDANTSDGQYYHQGTGNNAFSLFGSYRGDQYSLYASLNINNIKMQENGGLESLMDFYTRDHRTESYTMRTNSGKTLLKDRSFALTQTFSFQKFSSRNVSGATLPADSLRSALSTLEAMSDSLSASAVPDSMMQAAPRGVTRFTLVHNLEYRYFHRNFTDDAPGPNDLYPNAYINPFQTGDSVYVRRLTNSFELMFRERERARMTAGFAAGIYSELDKYTHSIIPDTSYNGSEMVITREDGETAANIAVTGRFFNHTGGTFNWDVGGRFFVTGEKAGSLELDGDVRFHYFTRRGRSTLTLGATLLNAEPGYFIKRYESNSYLWRTDFSQSQQIRLRAELENPARRFKAGVYVAQLNNWVYFDTLALPAQSSKALISVTGALEKEMVLGRFHFLFKLYGQYSSDEEQLPLPSFAGYQSSFYQQWLVRNVLNMQFGYDLRYHTRYYAYDFAPSTGVFFMQNNEKVGGFPFVDVFLTFKLKRVRLSVMGENLLTLLGSMDKKYFTTYGYPMPEARIKFGVSWSFYD